MIVTLRIRNLALIEDLTWELGPGFNTLTGETGAGKSILIDAISLLLGGRADKSLIRSGADACSVEAELTLFHDAERLTRINQLIEDLGAEKCEGSTLLLKRTLSGTSNRQFINGSTVTLQGLKSLGELLVDVHGPHDHQSLLSTEKQGSILDAYGKLSTKREAYTRVYRQWQSLIEEEAALQGNEQEREQRVAFLRHQVQEIEAAQLVAGEDAKLESDYRSGSNAQQLVAHASTIAGLLSESETAVITQMAQVERTLTAWQRVDTAINPAEELNREIIGKLEELLQLIQNEAERIDLDPGQLQQLEDRLNLVQSLKRKYGQTLEDVIAFGQRAAEQLATLESREKNLAGLQKKIGEARIELNRLAQELSKARQNVAGPLGTKVAKELHLLGFNKALFQVEVTTLSEPTPSGLDRIEFIFAPNPGEAPRPLRAIASSGEMARVMLAVKTTLAEVDEIPILIFDEVDANVGGETATQVGRKLRGLGDLHQVLCITHLPQVAAQGQSHFAVEKRVENGRTLTQLTRLDGQNRQRELARMLGGQTEAALGLAQSLIADALKTSS